MAAKGKFLDAVVEMRVDDEALIERISGRFTCGNCGEVYHDTEQAHRQGRASATSCGSTEFVRRADDNADAVRVRLMAYYRQTAPLIGYYHAKGKLRTVDGLAPIETISARDQEPARPVRKPPFRALDLAGRVPILRALSERRVVPSTFHLGDAGCLAQGHGYRKPAEGIGGLWLLDGGLGVAPEERSKDLARIAGVNIPTNKRVRDRAHLYPRHRPHQGAGDDRGARHRREPPRQRADRRRGAEDPRVHRREPARSRATCAARRR